MIFYNEDQAIKLCTENPTLIFDLIKDGYIDVVDKIITKHKNLINTKDDNGNNIMMRLLMKKEYNIVFKHMKNKNWDINNQNNDGNTFAHLLVTTTYLQIAKILTTLIKNQNFIPNIKNKNNETILDRAIKHNQLYTVAKILEDKKFDNIDIISFKDLYNQYIKNGYYGKYSKLNNLEIIVNSLKRKSSLQPKMKELLTKINNNMDNIKCELLTNKFSNLDIIIESFI